MVLVHKLSKSQVAIGDKVQSDFGDDRDIPMVVSGWQEPKHSASTGRVYVKTLDSGVPGAFGLEWMEVNHD